MIWVSLAILPEPPVAKLPAAQRRAVGKGAPVLRGEANPCPRAPLCDPFNLNGIQLESCFEITVDIQLMLNLCGS